MPEARATLIVEAKDEASANLGKIGTAGTKAGKETKAGFGDAAKALTGFDVASLAGVAGVTALAGAMVSSIKYTLDWAGSIDKLSRNTGLSTEEASKLAVVAGDVGIEIGTLERALKSMTKQGLELNIETLKKVSAEYQAAESPVDRMKIATKAFGAAAQDMTEILSRTPEELDKLTAAAERSGKVMSEENVAAAELFEQNLKQLQDTTQGLMVTFGNVAIPTLNKAGETLANEGKIAALVAIEFQRMTGQIDYNEAAQRAAAIAAGDLSAAFQEQYVTSTELTDAHERQAAAANYVSEVSIQTTANYAAFTVEAYGAARASYELELAQQATAEAASDLKFGMSELTAELIFQAAAAGLSAQDQLALAVSMGLVNKESLEAKNRLDDLRIQFNITDEAIANGTANVEGYSAAVARMGDQLAYAERQANALAQAAANAMANGSGATPGGGVVNGGSGGFAHGGNVYAGQSTVVGDSGRPELFVPRSDGYVYPVVPSANTSTTGDGGGDSGLMLAAIMNLPRAIRDALMK